MHDADAEQVSGSATAVDGGRAVGGARAVPLLGAQETPEALYRVLRQLVGLARTILATETAPRRWCRSVRPRPRPWRGVRRADALPYVRTAV